ncbi:MAG: IMPACT family protein, partial [bacterium]
MMTGKIEYYSIISETTAELTIKRSKFIAHASPTSATQSADKYIAAISKQFQDAKHNCFAYKIGTGDAASFRFSDAGEPSGTAGRPILRAIENRNLTNVVVVVSRYFGGIKLGAGGLSRAYHSAALTVLDKANIIEYHPRIIFSLKFP